MKVVQRNTELIIHDVKGTFTESGLANMHVIFILDKSKKYDLIGLNVSFQLSASSLDGNMEFEVRDFFVINDENKRLTTDNLWELINESIEKSYEVMKYESIRKKTMMPTMPALNEEDIKADIILDLNEYYQLGD